MTMYRCIWIFLLSFILFGDQAVALATENEYAVKAIKSNMVPMRDGTLLSTDLYLPDGASGKLPVILVRTVYGKNPVFEEAQALQTLLQRGYVIAVQDIRGRYESEGK
jgi:predicted acyl esterase